MTMTAEKQVQQIGSTRGCEDHDYDLVHELNRRLSFLWHCDQYIANAEKSSELQTVWRDFKRQEQENVKRLKQIITKHVQNGCF